MSVSDVSDVSDVSVSHVSAIDAGPIVPVICGPTAAGKSVLAMLLATHAPITIISADSRQLYRGFDIGTAKPTRTEQAQVPHAGVDVADPADRWSAWQWASMARDAIVRARALGRVPVIVGGTGFYIRALTHPLAEQQNLDPERRAALATWLERQTPASVHRWCMRLDPARASLGPVQQRRAIEVALLTGTTISTSHALPPTAPALRVRYLVVDPGVVLRERISGRVEAMLDAGWVAEVQRLAALVASDAAAWKATGYAEVLAHVHGLLSRAEVVEQVSVRTRQYAKRQRTWFRHQLVGADVTHVSPLDSDAHERVLSWWTESHTEMA